MFWVVGTYPDFVYISWGPAKSKVFFCTCTPGVIVDLTTPTSLPKFSVFSPN